MVLVMSTQSCLVIWRWRGVEGGCKAARWSHQSGGPGGSAPQTLWSCEADQMAMREGISSTMEGESRCGVASATLVSVHALCFSLSTALTLCWRSERQTSMEKYPLSAITQEFGGMRCEATSRSSAARSLREFETSQATMTSFVTSTAAVRRR